VAPGLRGFFSCLSLLDRDRFDLLEGSLAPEDFLDPILHEGGHPLLEA
jgi:hypothetical protein